jgi:ribonucleoside-diphosphate reductase alpha chain
MSDEKAGLKIERYFSKAGNPYDLIPWERSDVSISDDQGKFLYKQPGVEFPQAWSSLAKKIVASKYFYGENGTPQRETSVKNLIDRVTGTISSWGLNQGYFNEEQSKVFKEELAALNLNQLMAFNSPVWFNVGVDRYLDNSKRKLEQKNSFVFDPKTNSVISLPIGEEYKHPQTSACFIQSVNDTMEDIMQLAYNEAMLFKYGSGTGTDLSTLRSSKEKLSGGGIPSGPLAYLLFYDKVAGIVKSGGKTRRAAKMNSLRTEHPDIENFIECKLKEQKKLELLMDKGGLTYEDAESTVGYQNANLSIRASDAFMRAVEENREWQTIPVHNKDMTSEMPKHNARDLFKKIAKGTHACGDPGLQFHDTINRWHTCPNSAPINASNPCSEYMFVDNSSCNLASHNLMKYINEEKIFDVEKFSKAIKLTAIAQDLLYDSSSFPTKKIAENSHRFRPLGMGYANLGALEMFLGLPYDSDEGRAVAASITALMTGKVYEASSEMAEAVGPFLEFEKNKEPMLKVIGEHRAALKTINRSKLPKGLENVLDEAEKTWANVEERGRQYGFRNSQATVLAPTGTIGFMMDCDTTGIEPETWLVKQKNLSDGGVLKIVNETVPHALRQLGYNPDQIKQITEYMSNKGTIEGAPGLKEKDVPVFDCAYKAENGKRIIHYTGHLKMMAAVQPFLSGAISKTVGLPNEVTTQEIEQVYMDSWKMGLKAVALYRDGSKRRQPLTSSKNDLEKKAESPLIEPSKPSVALVPVRKKLPITAPSIRHKFNVAGHEGYLHMGLYEDGNPGELFVDMSKEGSTVGGLMDAIGVLTSIALQYGAPRDQIVKKLKGQKFEPRGLVLEGDKRIKTADSLVDYIFSYMGEMFPNGEKTSEKSETAPLKTTNVVDFVKNKVLSTASPTPEKTQEVSDSKEELGGFCIECGTQMIKKGHCTELCPKPGCGWRNLRGCGE